MVSHRVGGECDINNVNHKEALEIASLIAAAIGQPEYVAKTFGVISLLGDEQARDIESLLRRHLAPAIFEERRIICGNAAHFQGDERDVMFLSLVDSPQGNPLPYRDMPLFRKRFNVGASRARDQMWVVHSLDPDRDLQSGDLRRRLIHHAQDPMATIRKLQREQAKTDSEFERRVLGHLTELGYRVKTQWRVGFYRIDMVVEGSSARLAVECDGDKYHTMDNLQDDMIRQAVLERLGWKFIRIRGTRFFGNPDREIQRVVEKLNSLGIEKLGMPSVDEGAAPDTNELLQRLNRTAEEIRQLWARDPGYVFEEHPVKRRRQSSWSRQSQGERSSIAAAEPRMRPDSRGDEELPLENDAGERDLGTEVGDVAPPERIREILHRLVPPGEKVAKDELLKKLAKALGHQRLGRKIRSALNRAISGEARAGNLQTDWNFVWRGD